MPLQIFTRNSFDQAPPQYLEYARRLAVKRTLRPWRVQQYASLKALLKRFELLGD